MNYVLAIDQGTTGSTALLIRISPKHTIDIIGRKTVDFPQHYPKAGWVEHNLNEIWNSVTQAIKSAIEHAEADDKNFNKNKISCIGITNQRETLCVYDRQTLKPLRNAIVWQCRRSTEICQNLKAKNKEDYFRKKTGLLLDPYFSGTKISWILQNEPDVASHINNAKACVGTIDTFLLSMLSGGKSFATEASNASRTLLYDLNSGSFDKELMGELGLKSSDCLPEVKDSASNFGVTKGLGFLPDGIPITGILGDQQAALAGQACFNPGEAKCTYGTGAFLLTNIGDKMQAPPNGLLTTIAWQLNGKRTYAFEGSCFIAGAAMQFLRDQMYFIKHVNEIEARAEKAQAAPEVYYVPALAGLGAPYWDPKARGAFLGLTRGSSTDQILRAGIEGMALQVRDLCTVMSNAVPMKHLHVDGGAVANNLLLQIQADYLNIPVDRPVSIETTAFGAAMFAGLGAGIFANFDELRKIRVTHRKFEPSAAKQKEVATHNKGWQKAVKAVQFFAAE